MDFCTVLNGLSSPTNVGMLVRSHVAQGGNEFVMIGSAPWRFKKRSQSFSRKLEKDVNIVSLNDEGEFFDWAKQNKYSTVAIEINPEATPICSFIFPYKSAIVLGNERTGLSSSFQDQCDSIVRIPQFGSVGSMNVAISGSIVMYELNRTSDNELSIEDNLYVSHNK